jgi:hypothetical protein
MPPKTGVGEAHTSIRLYRNTDATLYAYNMASSRTSCRPKHVTKAEKSVSAPFRKGGAAKEAMHQVIQPVRFDDII